MAKPGHTPQVNPIKVIEPLNPIKGGCDDSTVRVSASPGRSGKRVWRALKDDGKSIESRSTYRP